MHTFSLPAGLITVDNESTARRVAAAVLPDMTRTEAMLLRCVAKEHNVSVEALLAEFAAKSAEQISSTTPLAAKASSTTRPVTALRRAVFLTAGA